MHNFNTLTLSIVICLIIVSSPNLSVIVFASNNVSEVINNNDTTHNVVTPPIPGQAGINANQVQVVASFYPIFEFVEKVGGDKVDTTSLIPVGVEPHDFESTIQQIQNAETADMLIFNGAGFEGPWIRSINAEFFVDVTKGLNLTEVVNDEHSTDTEEAQTLDPHVWLDPILAKQQISKIRDALTKIDPNNASYYNENARKFMSELDNLDATIRSQLANCEKRLYSFSQRI